MRIIAGKYKGRNLFEPKDGEVIRPTLTRARENLFNILASDIPGSSFLDLFAGTGSVGFEAESRGARVTLCDSSKVAYDLLFRNKKLLDSPARIVRGDYSGALKSGRYDIIFCDPPYESAYLDDVLTRADNVLTENGIIVYESDSAIVLDREDYEIYDSRKYGIAHFAFIRRK